MYDAACASSTGPPDTTRSVLAGVRAGSEADLGRCEGLQLQAARALAVAWQALELGQRCYKALQRSAGASVGPVGLV